MPRIWTLLLGASGWASSHISTGRACKSVIGDPPQFGRALRNFQGGRLYGKYGFFDSFNPSFRDTHVSLRSGSVDGRLGWVDNDYLSDNQGPILGMIANYKTGIIWNAIRKVPNLVRGLKQQALPAVG
jgi:hypothetical protein